MYCYCTFQTDGQALLSCLILSVLSDADFIQGGARESCLLELSSGGKLQRLARLFACAYLTTLSMQVQMGSWIRWGSAPLIALIAALSLASLAAECAQPPKPNSFVPPDRPACS